MQPGAPGGQPPQGYGQPPQGYPPQGGPPAAANPAQTAGIILLVCAAAIAIGTFTKSWMSASEGDESIGVGLWGVKVCEDDEGCQSISWGDAGDRTPGDIKIFGPFGFLAGLAAAGAAAAAGGMALSRNTGKIPNKVILGIFGAASFAQTFFLVRLMTEDKLSRGMSISYSGILSIGGLIAAGIVFKQMLAPQINAAKGLLPAATAMGGGYAPPMGAPPMGGQPPVAAAATMTCPRCQGQATFVAQYNRHFCNACQQYV